MTRESSLIYRWFQAVYAIKACAVDNIEDHRNRNIYILKTLDIYQNNPKLVWDCHQPIMKPADMDAVSQGIQGNETANQLARLGSERPFAGPEPACNILVGIAKKAVRDWT
jgi:hypothetical protein